MQGLGGSPPACLAEWRDGGSAYSGESLALRQTTLKLRLADGTQEERSQQNCFSLHFLFIFDTFLHVHSRGRGGRVAEGTGLLNLHRG